MIILGKGVPLAKKSDRGESILRSLALPHLIFYLLKEIWGLSRWFPNSGICPGRVCSGEWQRSRALSHQGHLAKAQLVSFVLIHVIQESNLGFSILHFQAQSHCYSENFPALSSFNSVRRHFNGSEPGQFRAETLISIHSLGTFSPDLSQEAKPLDPCGIVSKFLGARLPSSCERLTPFFSQTHLLAAFFLSFAFAFSSPSRPIDTIIRNSWFCAHIERRPEWVC